MSHPHPSRRHIMVAYRRFIVGLKANHRGMDSFRRAARSQVHYMDWVREYLEAKRDVFSEAGKAAQSGIGPLS